MPEDVVPNELDTPASTGTDEGQITPQGEVGEAREPETKTDDRYTGKSVDELRGILTEKERFIGRQADEIGKVRRLEEQVEQLRNYIESRQVPVPDTFAPEKPTAPPEEGFAFDFTKPEESINKLVESRLEKLRRENAARDEQNYYRTARANFDRGMDTAISQDRKLFEGIEKDVASAVAQMVKAKVVTPEMLSDPRTFKAAAVQMRYWRGELDRISGGRKPMAPTQMDTPGRVKTMPDDDDVSLSRADIEEMRKMGLSEKEAVEAIREGMAMRARGELR